MIPARRQPPVPQMQSFTLPAPVGGMNTVSPPGSLAPTECIFAYNLIPAENGVASRPGTREWVTGLDGPVRTLLPFQGTTSSANRLFATTSTGIWDVSSSTDAPTQVLAFASPADPAGWGVSHAFVNSAGAHFLLYADEQNGYHVYTESTATWTKIALGGGGTEISGIDPATFAFVTVWMNRVWFVRKDTAEAYYLAAGALYGAATKFNFGSKFKAGGNLVGLWNWTRDGADGMDDMLVGVSAGGDVAIYQGYDPADASKFSIVGVWQVGAPPAGRRIATAFGGDVLILSTLGLRAVSNLSASGSPQYATAKIANYFNPAVSTYRDARGWDLVIHPEANALLALVPTASDTATSQLAMSFATGGWFPWRDLPMTCAEAWDGVLYFGTADGRVCQNTGGLDGVTLADPSAFTPIQWSVLSCPSDLGSERRKKVELIQPRLRTEGSNPTYQAAARYDWDLTELGVVTDLASASGASSWDTAVWDAGVWGQGGTVISQWSGAAGTGTEVAIALRGTARDRVTLLKTKVLFTAGGLL